MMNAGTPVSSRGRMSAAREVKTRKLVESIAFLMMGLPVNQLEIKTQIEALKAEDLRSAPGRDSPQPCTKKILRRGATTDERDR